MTSSTRNCVAGQPNGQSCGNNSYTENTTMHQFPADPVIRVQWFRFVQVHLVYFAELLNKYACLCSTHFEEERYMFNPSIQSTLGGMKGIKTLNAGCVPTRHAVLPPRLKVFQGRKKPKLLIRLHSFNLCEHTDNQTCTVRILHVSNMFCFNYLSEYSGTSI